LNNVIMKKTTLLFIAAFTACISFSQLIFRDDFSTFNLAKIDGQSGWSTSTPSLGNGTGGCFSIGCQVSVTTKSLTYSNFGSCTQAINPIDGTLATGDGPGKSLSGAVNSGAVYVALLVNFKNPLSNPNTAKQIVRFMDNSFTTASRIYLKQVTGAFQVGVDKNGSASIVYSSSSYNYNQDHLLILKYEFNTSSSTDDVASVFIDPDLSLPEPTPIATITGVADVASITRIAFPWNSTSFLPNGYIGIVTTAKDWTNLAEQSVPTYNISGRTIAPLQKTIKTSKIKIATASTKDSISSAANGTYNFSNLVTDNYTIKPTKNNDITKANGVKSVDVILVQRHILNQNKLNSAYKIIAADVNGDKNINSVDVIRIKRLILGSDTTFTKGAGANKIDRLWEFVDSSYVFADTTNPFPFKDSINFTGLANNQTNQTFIGIKLGDVNYDWDATIARGVAVNNVELMVNDKWLMINDKQISIPVKVNNFKDITAMQYTLHFDNTKYEFVEMNNNKIGVEYNAARADKTGNISMLWIDKNAQPKTLEEGSELFTLVLRNKWGMASSELVLNNEIAEVEAWDNHFNSHNIILTKQKTKNEQPQTRNKLVIFPNPTKGIVNIECTGAKQIIITNVYGKEVLKKTINTQASIINIQGFAKGMYFVNLITNEGRKIEKLIVE
jgi:Secretion system C-terminal sorting domain/Dockerin type I domain